MKMLSLFSGIGGIDLAAQWAGMETVAFCEINKFCQQILHKHWQDVPIFTDVRNINKERLINEKIPQIDIIAGGFPCQPYSIVGKRRGQQDVRNLFPEMVRIISEVRPRWVVGENVVGFKSLGLDSLLTELEGAKYKAEAFAIPALAVAAPHERYRIFVVANALELGRDHDIPEPPGWVKIDTRTWNGRLLDQPGLLRVVDGLPSRLDYTTKARLEAIGNAVCPQQIYPILKCIKHIDDTIKAS